MLPIHRYVGDSLSSLVTEASMGRATRQSVTRRANLVVAPARCKNGVLAVLHRNLKRRHR